MSFSSGRTWCYVERTNIPAGKVYGRSPGNFDQFLDRTCPMNETAQGQAKPAEYAREVLMRELATWRTAVENATRQGDEMQIKLAEILKLQFDAQQRVASLETALRFV